MRGAVLHVHDHLDVQENGHFAALTFGIEC